MNRTTRPISHAAIRPGFTLIELMSAVAVTLILIVAISQVFSHVNTAVLTGQATTNVLSTSRIIHDQIHNDSSEMLSPRAGGILLIHNETKSAKLNELDPNPSTRQLDQLMFIRNRGDLEPLCPANKDSFSNSSDAAHCRMWYGHVKVDDVEPESMEHAALWVLGRQALFLEADSNGSNRADDARASTLANGEYDIAKVGLWANGIGGSLVGGPGASNAELRVGQSPGDYASSAKALAFISDRLNTVPVPPSVLGDSIDATAITSDEVGRMHAYFAAGVSDFSVQFAGDYDPRDGRVDTKTENGQKVIEWYDDENPPPSFGSDPQAPEKNGSTFVFRHGSGNTNWPYLLRIRYRVQDVKGRVAGFDGEPGIWFEQIIQVSRE